MTVLKICLKIVIIYLLFVGLSGIGSVDTKNSKFFNYCFTDMFKNCYSLTKAPAITISKNNSDNSANCVRILFKYV